MLTCLAGLAKGDAKPLSDVDIAVYLDEGVDRIQAKLDILEDLIDILNTDQIDLIVLNQSSLPLSMNVIKNNRLLVDKQPFVRHAHYSLVIAKIFRLQPIGVVHTEKAVFSWLIKPLFSEN